MTNSGETHAVYTSDALVRMVWVFYILPYYFVRGGHFMKDKIFGVLQRVGRSFMLPIALLPVAGL